MSVTALCAWSVLGVGCGENPGEEVGAVQSALTQVTISGRVTQNGAGVAGLAIRLTGAAQAMAATNTTGNYSFPGLPTGSYSLSIQKPGCTFSPSVANLNSVTTNKTQNFTATGSTCVTPGSARALVLVDSRLYALLASNIDVYKAQAEARRGFKIDLRNNQQFDDLTPAAVKSYIVSARAANPAIEGVLFIGNIKLPSFYKIRQDITNTRYMPRYYEDLDGVFSKRYATGEVDPVCTAGATPATKCVVSPRTDNESGPVTVLAHDVDDTDFGANHVPELWSSYMPVGDHINANTYADFANQLRPYFQKLVRFYNRELIANGRYYYVGNDKGEQFDENWTAWGKNNIDFYGKPGPNGETDVNCIQGGVNLCYKRWPVETYADSASFEAAYAAQPWVGENWQQDSIFIQHMNSQIYSVSEVDVHSNNSVSLISFTQAKALTNTALIAVSDGCGVTGFKQPFPQAQTDVDSWAAASQNIMLSYLYGLSSVVASFGSSAWRAHYANYPTMYQHLLHTAGSYLGAANKARITRQYAESADKYQLKEKTDEMMFGDPFMDLQN